MVMEAVSGGSKIFEKGGGGRQFISSALIYRKCTQRSIGLLHGNRRLLEKNWANRGAATPRPTPLNPPLEAALARVNGPW